jgi:hypothetical protein
MEKRISLVGLAVLAALLSGCGENVYQKYAGHWTSAATPPSQVTLDIAKTGDVVLIKRSAVAEDAGAMFVINNAHKVYKTVSDNYTAEIKGQDLVVSGLGGGMIVPIDAKTGHLIMGSEEFKR